MLGVRHILRTVAALLVLCPATSAQLGQSQEIDYPGPEDETPRRKKPRWFGGPAMTNAAEQLAYANSLLSQPGKRREAEKQYRELVHEWPQSPEAPLAQMAYAGLLEERGKHRRAFEECQYLIEFYTGSFPYQGVLERQFRIAHQVMTGRQGKLIFLRGFEAPERAIPMFRKIVENAPSWKKAAEAQYLVGVILEGDHEYAEAVVAYERAMTRYPESEFASEGEFRRAVSLYKLADKRPRDEKSCRVALTALSRFLNRYADSDNAQSADQYRQALQERLTALYYERAVFYDRAARRPRAALIAYRDFVQQCPSAEQIPAVKARIEQLLEQLENEHDEE